MPAEEGVVKLVVKWQRSGSFFTSRCLLKKARTTSHATDEHDMDLYPIVKLVVKLVVELLVK